MRTAYSYIRFSTVEQRHGRSYDRQREKAEKYCRENGLHLDTSFRLHDDGVSAFHGKNIRSGTLGRFLVAVEAGKIKTGAVLIIENLDRLSREEIEEAQNTFKRILKAGIDIVTLSDYKVYTRESLNDPFAIIQAILYMSRAHEESETKSKRVADAWNKKRQALQQNGTLLTHKYPSWLKYDDTRKLFIQIPERTKVINKIFDLAANGFGKTKIVKELNKARIPAFRGHGWATSSVQKILHNRALIGEYQPHKLVTGKRVPQGDVIQKYFPTIIEPRVFHNLQNKNGSPGPQNNSDKVNNLFTGILTCGYCGSSMYYVDKGNDKYLVCSSAKKGAGCKYVSYKYEDFEDSFLKSCKEELEIPALFTDDASKQASIAIAGLRKEIAGIEAHITDNRNRTQKLMIQFTDTTNKELKHNLDSLLSSMTTETEKLVNRVKTDKRELVEAEFAANGLRDKLKSIVDPCNDKRLKTDKDLRLKLRNDIHDLVDSIAVFPGGVKNANRVLDFLADKNIKAIPAETDRDHKRFFIRYRGHSHYPKGFPPQVQKYFKLTKVKAI